GQQTHSTTGRPHWISIAAARTHAHNNLYNARMASIDLILPFALPPPELARDLLRQARLPALATLLGKGRVDWHSTDPWARQLPHQRWLLQQRGLGLADNGIAATAMKHVGIEPGAGRWFVLSPANLHIARDHL